MRIKAIQLSWFRGAADAALLDLDCKSTVVYGVNGSGKSSFVDAVEYVLNDGKITHLAHEYSGKRQERAVLNTHKPPGSKTELTITFRDDTELKTEITQDGSSTRSGATVAMHVWDYRRTVLRQNEVAEFIHDTKGRKYSALLPLLGLHQLEMAAENLRQLIKSVEEQSRLKETRVTLKEVGAKREAAFGTNSEDEILTKIKDLHATYCPDQTTAEDPLSRCNELKTAIHTRIAGSSADQRRHVILQSAAALHLSSHVDAVRTGTAELAGAVEPLIVEKLEVLQSTGAFVERLGDENKVKCPACGQAISVDAFKAHVDTERERLHEISNIFDTRKSAIGTLCDALKSLRSELRKADVKSWRDEPANGPLLSNFAYLDGINVDALRTSCAEHDLQAIESRLLPLIEAASRAARGAPPDAQQLSTDKQTVEAAIAVIAAIDQTAAVARAETLVSFITSLEQSIREEIKLRSQAVIDDISSDILAMWEILHPGEAIEHVRLYLPKHADKAIDIGLKFHGIEQESPRLTLSEGYRNSLGLCIFLAMAKREAENDRPLFLDDVVVSLDRNHLGMVVELLEKQFSARQVVILTHDREWFTELRHQLDDKIWAFKSLLPYETPDIGIRWSHKTTTFGDARAHLKNCPDSAGNDARKIMDVELALSAERLQIKLPYLRADKNDKRMAHEFLERISADGKKCFEKNTGEGYKVHTDTLEAFQAADRLLLSWANRASHTFGLAPSEAAKLIDVCEKALEFFKCSSCGRGVWFANSEGAEWVQCHCGQIRWRYGKA
jgi:recombinational DNA repair ATPase RecF